MKHYSTNSLISNESQELRMKQNLARRAFLLRRAEELEEELTRIKLEIKVNRLEGATMHNEHVCILRLPLEITAYIFEVARGQTRFDNSAQDGPWKSIKKRPEIIISHVCRSWRSISLAHPTLWSHFLHIHAEDSGMPVPLNWMTAYLRRSKKKPLDVVLDLTCVPEGHDDNRYADRILDVLIVHAARWRRLCMYVSHDEWDPYAAPSPLRLLSAPILEVFQIAYLEHEPCYSEEDHSIFLGGAPNLVSVMMESTRCRALIPSSTITTLHICGPPHIIASTEPWDTFLSVMSVPTWVNLTIEGTCFEEPWPIRSAPRDIQRIVAPRLRNLRLNASDEVANFIWKFVAAPQLELFAIFNTHHLKKSIPILQDLSASSFASLKTLMLFNCHDVDAAFLMALSRITASLIHLILDADSDGTMTTYINHMVSIGTSSVLWPNLESVGCVGRYLPSEISARPGLAACAKVISWQAAKSGKPCVLRVGAKIAKNWMHQSQSKKELWEYLLQTGVVEIAKEDGPYSSAIPWPHHASGHFRIGKSEVGTEI